MGIVGEVCGSSDTAHVAPVLALDEPAPPGMITVLVLDGHSGDPIRAHLTLDPIRRIAEADLTGVARFTDMAPGRYGIVIRAMGYRAKVDSLVVSSTAGRIRIAQLRRYSCGMVSEPMVRTRQQLRLRPVPIVGGHQQLRLRSVPRYKSPTASS